MSKSTMRVMVKMKKDNRFMVEKLTMRLKGFWGLKRMEVKFYVVVLKI